jgi:hypothetical protein
MGYSNQDAYMRALPDRYQRLLVNGISSKDIASHVASYHRGRLVNLIMEQSLVPVHVLNQDMYQKALNELAMIGFDDDVSPKVRVEALTSLAGQLKPPQAQKHELAMTINESSGMNELKESLRQLAQKQTQLIECGTPTALIAASPLVEAEFTEVDPDQEDAR